MSSLPFERTYGNDSIPTLILSGEQIVFANSEVRSLFGTDQLEHLDDLLSLPNLPTPQPLRQALRVDPSTRKDTPWRGCIGASERIYRLDLVPLPLAETYYVGRFHLQEQASQERLHLRAVLESMPMAVLLFRRDGKVLELNNLAKFFVGRNQWNQIGEQDHPFQLLNARGHPLLKKDWPLIRALERGELCDEEEFILDFGNLRRHLSISVIPVTDKDGKTTSYLVTGKDITQRSETERRKDEFLSIASHELRSPLTPLTGFLQLARKDAEEGHPVDPSLLRRAESQVHRIKRLIEGLLDMTRLETGQLPIHPRHVQMKPLVKKIVEPWLRRENVSIELHLPETSFQARIDPDRFDQVLTNVIDNALKHGASNAPVVVTLTRDANKAVCSIRDSGEGIEPEVQERLFERFFFKENSSHGQGRQSMGLGLYISRQIVEGHGGTITLDSRPGQGTEVTIQLPLATPP